ncbi:Subtilisin-like protease SBT4.12 [Linum grandiflorum]
MLQLQTTRSWDFLGFHQPAMIKNLKAGSDIVVGMIDSGVWPELPSFDAGGLGPPPSKWKGVCKGGQNFTCNNKVIGARYYPSSRLSARDLEGHGSHTASTAAGSVVKDASFYGVASGSARGGLPSARIAAYAVCENGRCSSTDIMAAFDDAIADGVDVISISLSPTVPENLDEDPISIGAFHAANKGILTVQSAGNGYAAAGNIVSVAPWLLSVAASTIDRKFESKVVLGNGKTVAGNSINRFTMNEKEYPLVDGINATSEVCSEREASLAKGKILLCNSTIGPQVASEAGAAGVIFTYNYNEPDVQEIVSFPSTTLDPKTFRAVEAYIQSTTKPVAKILKSDTVTDPKAPVVATFSSRGPNSLVPSILKPDISAPGVDILAGWSPEAPLTNTMFSNSLSDQTQNNFNVLSGTSMSCPHVAGIAAYVKSLYPNWSPSAIKSAIMTTATPMRPLSDQLLEAEFAYGAGQLNPVNASNPGLVYETLPTDYVKLLCNLGYNTNRVQAITGDKTSTCPGQPNRAAINDFNYPSIAAAIPPKSVASFSIRFRRTVTNVGFAKSIYKAQIVGWKGLKIEVAPRVLSFGSLNEKMSFNVTVSGGSAKEYEFFASAALIWNDGKHTVYIVYMGALPKHQYSPTDHHLSLIQEVLDDDSGLGQELLIHTTRSWDFLGLPQPTSTPTVKAGSDVVVGVIDTGIWPESASFDDRGFGPPPAKWKGVCKGGTNFTCNNKIIGARYYAQIESARDNVGHGTHTSSTVAGNAVKGASFHGIASGVARGGLPSARIAVYAVCNELSCPSNDILAAFDDAIADGVDVISISIGPTFAFPLEDEPIPIGSFHAANKGILTVQSAGNNGPATGTVASVAPWLLSVAASTIDRKIETKVMLGNGKIVVGGSINGFNESAKELPLIDGEKASSNTCLRPSAASDCNIGCLDNSKVQGKILVCTSASGLSTEFGAAGMIFLDERPDSGRVLPLPAAQVDQPSLDVITAYERSTISPIAKILKSDTAKDTGAPVVASFSSRGPNSIIPGILKPDVTAPGVEILASWPPGVSPNNDYNVISGTSMSCPHVAGIAAYIKSLFPSWSPSAIQSAIMTTATPMHPRSGTDPDLKYASAEFSYGSGQLNPVNATNPGLVYETLPADYVKLLCNLGYGTDKVRAITGDKTSSCTGQPDSTAINNFNYPSLTAALPPKSVASFSVQFTRTVTNVGSAKSTYKAQIVGGKELKIEVTPSVLTFASLNEKKSFNVSVSGGKAPSSGFFASASLIWSDGTHNVRSPIVIYTPPHSSAFQQ